MQDTYNIKKVGVGVITFLSLATASTSIHSTSMTSGMADMHSYASAYVINDNQGSVCLSSSLSDKTTGDIIMNVDNDDLVPITHNLMSAKLHIREVKTHVSKFDFEDEYEEI
jgi:hypothetical protein